MNNDVLTEYTKFINNTILQFFRILLGSSYSASIVKPLVNKYIDVRYYNDTIYESEKDVVTRISKELNLLAKEMLKELPEKEELIKNITALFGYIIYLDDCIIYDSLDDLLDSLFSDEIIKLKYNENTRKDLEELLNNAIDKKSEYLYLFQTEDFELKFQKLKTHLYDVNIKEYCKVSKLYSDYAIDRAFNTGTLAEDKIYLLLVMLGYQILCNVITLEYNDNYIVSFPVSVLDKPKKILRYHTAMNNDYLKDHIYLTFTYSDFLDNRKKIKELISSGYKVAAILDGSFKMDTESLSIFSYCIVFKDAMYYDSLMDIKDSLQTEFIDM